MKELLDQAGIKEQPLSIKPLSGGANNRVYRLDFKERSPLVCKHYFQHPDDKRPRLKSEYAFLSYAWENGMRQVPQPLACDETHQAALYSFVPGKSPETVTEEMVDQALDFFLVLNQNRKAAKGLSLASEGCLFIEDYFSTVERKLSQCQAIPEITPLHRDVKEFIQKALLPRWKQILKSIPSGLSQAVSEQDLCVTPSDFGFHNALIDAKRLYFLDFEYAGWDDPTKTACDFFCQPKVPVPFRLFEKVASAIANTAQNPEAYLKRMRALLPVCRIKWCCIILNVFQKTGSERRRFSDPEFLEKLEKQLALAKHTLERLTDGLH